MFGHQQKIEAKVGGGHSALFCEPRENLYQVLQVTCTVSERAMKLKVRMIKSISP